MSVFLSLLQGQLMLPCLEFLKSVKNEVLLPVEALRWRGLGEFARACRLKA